MSGISTDKKFAILSAERGINLDTFPTMTALAEQAMRSAMWEMTPEEHAAWAERMVAMVREHRDLPALPGAPALKLWCSGCNKPTTWALSLELWKANYGEKCPACGGEITMAQVVTDGVGVERYQSKASHTPMDSVREPAAVQVDAPLPPMPTHAGRMEWESLRFGKPGFTADQMREYVLADRRQRAAPVAVAEVVESQPDAIEAHIKWLLNPMPVGTVLFEAQADVPQSVEPTDSQLLDWLDEINRRKNEHNGTRYGWRLSENCNRIALEDHNFPALSVRDAIRAAWGRARTLTQVPNG